MASNKRDDGQIPETSNSTRKRVRRNLKAHMVDDEVVSVVQLPAESEICAVNTPLHVPDTGLDSAIGGTASPSENSDTHDHGVSSCPSESGDCESTISVDQDSSLHHNHSDEIPEYKPPILDHEDAEVDKLLEEIHTVMQKECYADLCDDFTECVEILAEKVEDIVEVESENDDTHELSHTKTADEEPIYPGSTRKLGVCVLLLCVFMIRYRLSDDTMHYLLTLLGLLLPDTSRMITSLYGLRKYLRKLTFLPEVQYYCSFCYTLCDTKANKCPNQICGQDLSKAGSVSYFIRHKLISQLQILFKRERFTTMIRTHRLKHYRSTKKDTISDVYDGSTYKKLFDDGLLSDKNSVSFAMNTDGVAIFKSSKVSMWPVYLLINELPIRERKLRENTLFYGIWLSPKKPIMWSFLQPLFHEIKTLEDGVQLQDHTGEFFTCRATLLTCTCDLPAKALVTNSVQFNGKNSCWHCFQPGQTERTDRGGCVHAFPFQTDNPKGPSRTSDSVRRDVHHVIQNIKSGINDYIVNGIKGPNCLMYLKYFNIVDGFIVDYMHGVCSGVMRLLLKLWFNNTHKNSPFSVFPLRERVNSMLKSIKPTMDITRVPRSLDEVVYWKASEYKNFLLFWGIPILNRVLPTAYFIHFVCLSKAVYLLSQESIKTENLVIAETLLLQFVRDFGELYSLRFMTMNVHQLVHLADCVRKTGPLFVNNCFIFEDLNGFLVSHLHGTQGIDSQVIKSITLIQAIPVLQEKFGGIDDEADYFLDVLRGTAQSTCNILQSGIYRIGNTYLRTVTGNDYTALKVLFPTLDSNIFTSWSKIFIDKNNSYVYGTCYKRLVRRDQSVVKYHKAKDSRIGFGSVKYFIHIPECGHDKNINVALIEPFQVKGFYDVNSHIHPVRANPEEIIVIPLQDIISVCLHVTTGESNYVCYPPNRYDKD